uniref:UBZ1-type domain-containing protein n=1 Tax=Bombyx mori TaxID=7091 RepID=A0A8R1WGE9_BOMMO|nr:protein spindle-F [Bombyx mori]
MDTSSIVSFNNDSTFQATLKGDYNHHSVHELALHAMRDRCLLLQRRINVLENDNMRLKLDATRNNENIAFHDDDKLDLLQKIAELNKQKSQLMHHVFMVSCENRNLWNKISTIKNCNKPNKENVKNPLVRTNTYIQSTPKTSVNYQEKYSESSLEEISLKLINSYIQEKSNLVDQYEQMAQLHRDEDMLNVDSIGFTYLEDPAMESLKDIISQTEKVQSLRKEVIQQENDLKVILARFETIVAEGYKCPTCITNNTKVVSSENKQIETSDSLMNWETPADSSSCNNNFSDINTSVIKESIIEEKEEDNEPFDKICPMCGQTFQKDTEFSEFRVHVESHFTGETEPDSLIDNFENIPSSFENAL